MPKGKVNTEIDILELEKGRIECAVKGKTPLLCNAMSNKVINELLLPGEKKNRAERAASLKHIPREEFRSSMYKTDEGPTLIYAPAEWFKAAISNAALDLPGPTKAQISRLVWVEGTKVPIYGVPLLHMGVTRCKDMNRTPDVRTRAILPEWACFLTITFFKPMLKRDPVVNLLAAAGSITGVGDYRPQKGKGNFGQFELAEDDDFKRIVTEQGREAQEKAMAEPVCYDNEAETILAWWDSEVKRRGFEVA